MAWTIKYATTAEKQLRKLDRQIARRIVDFMDNRIAALDDPRGIGKTLSGPLGDLWRYRVGDYRVICDINNDELTVIVVRVGHRRKVYLEN
ncbi:MAG: type II toxin-antitoxin system RelE/ParE family toxin [Pseudomonadota bacterium]|nr:type II toxin-antitoxin system RelE/ParE family toxin [Pseudomonadota bacterium]